MISNRINYLLRFRKKAENNVNPNKLSGLTTRPSCTNYKESIDFAGRTNEPNS